MLQCPLLDAMAAMAADTITVVLGSPSATITVDGKQLPAHDLKFGDAIKENAKEKKQWYKNSVKLHYFWVYAY